MIVRSTDSALLANAYLVGDQPGGHGVIIDAGAPPGPLITAAERLELSVDLVLLTHHHDDHSRHAQELRAALDLEVCAHPAEASRLTLVDRELIPGVLIETGNLGITPLHTPGHTAGGLAYLINGESLFTGDTLFKRSIGCLWAPGATSFADHRHSILEVLMTLAPQTMVYPGHSDVTTIGAEWEANPFVRRWRGLEPEDGGACTMAGRPADIVVWARDYDDGHKAWVRWNDTDEDDVMPGSKLIVTKPGRHSVKGMSDEPAEPERAQTAEEVPSLRSGVSQSAGSRPSRKAPL